MAITKTGNKILSNTLDKLKRAGSLAMRFGFPAITTAAAANDIISGNRTVGGALGESIGSLGGFYAASKGMNLLNKKFKIPYISSIASFVVPGFAAMYGGDVGSSILRKVIPWKRTPINSNN